MTQTTTEIFLIRHGETDWNAEQRLQGHLDIALNSEGERQAAALGHVLSGEQIDAVFASDLQRALQTARAIAAPRGIEVHIDRGLRERCYGGFEGLRHPEILDRYPDAYAAWRARELDFRYPSGTHAAETLREFSGRSLEAIARIASAHRGRRIAIVSHGGVLDCVYRSATGMGHAPARNFDILNASVSRILHGEAGMRIVHWGDVAHLTRLSLDEVNE